MDLEAIAKKFLEDSMPGYTISEVNLRIKEQETGEQVYVTFEPETDK